MSRGGDAKVDITLDMSSLRDKHLDADTNDKEDEDVEGPNQGNVNGNLSDIIR